jgi:hypothetical protein
MQTLNKTQYHCAELRGSVPLIQRVEWVSGIGQDGSVAKIGGSQR